MLVLLRNEQTWEDQTNCSLTEEQTYSARSMSTNVHQVPTHLERGLHEVQVYPVFMMEALNVKSMSVMEPAALWTTGHVHDPKDSGAMELSLCVCLWFQILNWRTAKSQGQLGLQSEFKTRLCYVIKLWQMCNERNSEARLKGKTGSRERRESTRKRN